MKILLKSPYECLAKTANAQCELSANDILEIEDEEFVCIYPQRREIIPFYINLAALRDCENYSVLVRNGKTFVILENYSNFEVRMKENLNFSGKTCQINISSDKISFEMGGKTVECNCSPKDYKVFKIKSFACVEFKDNLYAFATKLGKLYHFSGEIEINDDQVTVTRDFHDSSARQRRSIFRLNEDLELVDEEFVTLSRAQVKELSPYKLMESIKAKDYAAAVSLLSKKLQEKIGVEQIKQFFGNVTCFLPLSTTEFLSMNGKRKNYVSFSLSGNLIDDISVDEV